MESLTQKTSHTSRKLEWLLPLAALLLYVGLAWLTRADSLGVKDEARYVEDARNLLTHGDLLPEASPSVVNGPGYPLVLVPLLAMDAPPVALRMLNGVFAALAVWFSWRAVLTAGGARGWALLAGLFVMLHPSHLRQGQWAMTESITLCCLSGFVWGLVAVLRAGAGRAPRGALLGGAFALIWLAMTRVVFGYVIMAMLAVMAGAWLVAPHFRSGLQRALLLFAIAFAGCIPWLAYTHHKTGRHMVWATTAGELQYWLTSTHPGENGHWFSIHETVKDPDLIPNHKAFSDELLAVPKGEWEARYKARVKENLKTASPARLAENYASNICRLFFGFPRSYQAEKLSTLALILANVPLMILGGLAAWFSLRWWKRLPLDALLLLAFTAIYLGGSTLATAFPRYSMIVIPSLLTACAIVLPRCLRISALKPESESDQNR